MCSDKNAAVRRRGLDSYIKQPNASVDTKIHSEELYDIVFAIIISLSRITRFKHNND